MGFLSGIFGKKNIIIDTYAQSIADDLFSHTHPLQAEKYIQGTFGDDTNAKKEKQEIIRKINEIINSTQQFKATHSLGVYQKARLHLKFSERLQELGYSENVAKEINKAIMYRSL